MVNMPDSVRVMSYNSRQYQPSGVIAFIMFPHLHYRKLQKEVNIPYKKHNYGPVVLRNTNTNI